MDPGIPRVLLVEDIESTREALKEVLTLEDLNVVAVSNRDEALAAIRRIAFHVVCVDLGLDESDPTNLHGKDILCEIARLREGTRSIIISQKELHHVTVEAFEALQLARYFRKGQFRIRELAEGVLKEASEVSLRIFECHSSALDALLHGNEQNAWIQEALQVLAPKSDLTNLRRIVDAMAGKLGPLRPTKDLMKRAVVLPEASQVMFSFWSRAYGKAMRCYIQTADEARPDGLIENTMRVFNLDGYTVFDSDSSIDSFLD